jgi:hypothetical protein
MLGICERFGKLPSEVRAESEDFLTMLAIERLWLAE